MPEEEPLPHGTLARGFSLNPRPKWPLASAAEIVELRYGRALTESKRRSGSTPVYGTNGQCGWHDTALAEGPGVILGRKGMGHLGVEWSEKPFWVIDTAYYVQPRIEELDFRFFYYLISYIGLDHLKDGTSNPSLSRDTFGAQLLPLPPLKEQRRIADVFAMFDVKIEHNQRTARALEKLARATFRAWFVDFEPVKAKAAGGKGFPSMTQQAFELLPTHLQERDDRSTPGDWPIGNLANLADLSREQLLPQDYPNETFEHFSIPAYDSGAQPKLERGETIRSGKFVVPADCVLISKLNPKTPRVWAPAPAAGPRQISSTEFLVVEPQDQNDRFFLYWQFQQPEFQAEMAQRAFGTSNSHQRVSPKDFLATSLIVPPALLRRAFAEIAQPILAKLHQCHQESRRLAQMRDYLLPKLLSGEVRVEAAEELARDAG